MSKAIRTTEVKCLECQSCHHQWQPKDPEKLPKACPKCGSKNWMTGRKRAPIQQQRASKAKRILQEAQKIKSTKIANLHLPILDDAERAQALQEMGAVLIVENDMLRISGNVNAGEWRDLGEWTNISESTRELLDWRDGDIIVEINPNNGYCLLGDGISPGDRLHFRPMAPENGDIVLAVGSDENGSRFQVAKHYWRHNGIVELTGSNREDSDTIRVDVKKMEILGVLVKPLFRDYRKGKR